MSISISYVCVFVQYHQMAIPDLKHSPSIHGPNKRTVYIFRQFHVKHIVYGLFFINR